jgi:predicted permease
MEDLMLQEFRYAMRVLRKNLGFSITVIITLALAIGANSALFSVVNSVLLNPLPYPHPEELVTIHQSKPNFSMGAMPYPNFLDLQKENQTFVAMALSRPMDFTLISAGVSERVEAQLVTADFFSLLGVKPVLGRTFRRGEDQSGAEPVVLMNEGLWKRKFGYFSKIIGESIVLDDRSYTVVGIIPSSFHLRVSLFESADVYVPMGQWNNPALKRRGAALALHGIGRMKPGVSIATAQADLNRIMQNLAATYPDTNKDNGARIVLLKERITGRVRPVLWILLGAVGFVLLIACVNVSNLMLAFTTGRTREFAIRAALGSGHRRLIIQTLTQTTLLSLIGGTLGLILAALATSAAIHLIPPTFPRAEDISIDARVLLFTIGVSILAGLFSGLIPSLRISHWRLSEIVKKGERVSGRLPMQNIFVPVQIALALVLLIGAGLMIRTLVALWSVDPGFRSENVLTFGLNLPTAAEDASAESVRVNLLELSRKIKAVPGVRAVSLSLGSKPLQDSDDNTFRLEGEPEPAEPSAAKSAVIYVIEPGYIDAMGIQLKQGRFFNEQDDVHRVPVAVIDEVLARKYFPNTNPIGKQILYEERLRQIVGVVRHVKQYGLESDDSASVRAQLYNAVSQLGDDDLSGLTTVNVFVRSEVAPELLFQTIRQVVAQQNSRNVVYQPQTMNQIISESISSRRFVMTLLAIFAVVALILASVGIYGVISYVFGQRTRELGIRTALGAQRADVLNLVMRHGMKMALGGVGLGLVAAFVLTRLMSTMLYGASPTDPATFAVVAFLFIGVALLACYVPARRATAVDPLTALRWE